MDCDLRYYPFQGERHGSAAERLLAGSRQSLLKDQQQQQVMANVMSTMMSSMVVPTGATTSAANARVTPTTATIPGKSSLYSSIAFFFDLLISMALY